jgi:hypothetical protein
MKYSCDDIILLLSRTNDVLLGFVFETATVILPARHHKGLEKDVEQSKSQKQITRLHHGP